MNKKGERARDLPDDLFVVVGTVVVSLAFTIDANFEAADWASASD
jgi:uncharacterized protein (DUF983 family)